MPLFNTDSFNTTKSNFRLRPKTGNTVTGICLECQQQMLMVLSNKFCTKYAGQMREVLTLEPCQCGCTKFFDGPYREEQWLVVCIKCLTLYQLNPQTSKLKIIQPLLTEKERIEYTIMAQQGNKARSYQI